MIGVSKLLVVVELLLVWLIFYLPRGEEKVTECQEEKEDLLTLGTAGMSSSVWDY